MLLDKKNVLIVIPELSDTTIQLLCEKVAFYLSSSVEAATYVGEYPQLKMRTLREGPKRSLTLYLCSSRSLKFYYDIHTEIDHVIYLGVPIDTRINPITSVASSDTLKRYYMTLSTSHRFSYPTVDFQIFDQDQLDCCALKIANKIVQNAIDARRSEEVCVSMQSV